jgi:hypothetical protein
MHSVLTAMRTEFFKRKFFFMEAFVLAEPIIGSFANRASEFYKLFVNAGHNLSLESKKFRK